MSGAVWEAGTVAGPRECVVREAAEADEMVVLRRPFMPMGEEAAADLASHVRVRLWKTAAGS